MPFSTNERISVGEKLAYQLVSTAGTSPGEKFWYSEIVAWAPIVPASKVWEEATSIPGAAIPADADAAVAAYPALLERVDYRLTLDVTSNNRAYFCRSTFNDNTSSIVGDWLLPPLFPVNGGPSFGYSIRLFHGDPAGAGVELFTTERAGPLGEPSWAWNYSTGVLTISDDESSFFRTNYYDINGLWVRGYRYIGAVGGSSTNNMVWNNTGSVIPVNTAVRVTGDWPALGIPTVAPIASTADTVIGITTTAIADGASGTIIRVGRFVANGFDTSLSTPEASFYADGTGVLSLSSGTPELGQVLSLGANGVIYVNIGGAGGSDMNENDILTASIEINNIVQDGRYNGNEIQFVVIDNNGHVVII